MKRNGHWIFVVVACCTVWKWWWIASGARPICHSDGISFPRLRPYRKDSFEVFTTLETQTSKWSSSPTRTAHILPRQTDRVSTDDCQLLESTHKDCYWWFCSSMHHLSWVRIVCCSVIQILQARTAKLNLGSRHLEKIDSTHGQGLQSCKYTKQPIWPLTTTQLPCFRESAQAAARFKLLSTGEVARTIMDLFTRGSDLVLQTIALV